MILAAMVLPPNFYCKNCLRVVSAMRGNPPLVSDLGQRLNSIPWRLAEFYYNAGLQRPYSGTYTILQETINRFVVRLLFFLEVKHIIQI